MVGEAWFEVRREGKENVGVDFNFDYWLFLKKIRFFWEFHTIYFVHICLLNFYPTLSPSICPSVLSFLPNPYDWFVLLKHSLLWGLPWSVVSLPRMTPLKKTPPSSPVVFNCQSVLVWVCDFMLTSFLCADTLSGFNTSKSCVLS